MDNTTLDRPSESGIGGSGSGGGAGTDTSTLADVDVEEPDVVSPAAVPVRAKALPTPPAKELPRPARKATPSTTSSNSSSGGFASSSRATTDGGGGEGRSSTGQLSRTPSGERTPPPERDAGSVSRVQRSVTSDASGPPRRPVTNEQMGSSTASRDRGGSGWVSAKVNNSADGASGTQPTTNRASTSSATVSSRPNTSVRALALSPRATGGPIAPQEKPAASSNPRQSDPSSPSAFARTKSGDIGRVSAGRKPPSSLAASSDSGMASPTMTSASAAAAAKKTATSTEPPSRSDSVGRKTGGLGALLTGADASTSSILGKASRVHVDPHLHSLNFKQFVCEISRVHHF